MNPFCIIDMLFFRTCIQPPSAEPTHLDERGWGTTWTQRTQCRVTCWGLLKISLC